MPIATGAIRVRLRVVLLRGAHQWAVGVLLHSLDEFIPVRRKQTAHLVGSSSFVLVKKDGSVVRIRCRQVHDHGSMVKHKVGAIGIDAVHGVDTVARIQECLGRQRRRNIGLEIQSVIRRDDGTKERWVVVCVYT